MSSGEEDDDMWEEETEDASSPAVCLFCNETSNSAEGVFLHCHKAHQFDLTLMKKKHGKKMNLNMSMIYNVTSLLLNASL